MVNFLGALGFLTRIRVPDRALARPLNSTAQYFPAVGVVIGLIVAGVFQLAALVLPVLPSVILSTAVGALVTGGFHEDGLSDSADGLGGGWTKEDVLRIMQDSRVGSFGALALVLVMALKVSTLAEIPKSWIAFSLIAGHAISRFVATSFTFTHEYVRFEGKNKPLADGISARQLL
jgi:adenosylcobinamide-GDP ribazoletransferase